MAAAKQKHLERGLKDEARERIAKVVNEVRVDESREQGHVVRTLPPNCTLAHDVVMARSPSRAICVTVKKNGLCHTLQILGIY